MKFAVAALLYLACLPAVWAAETPASLALLSVPEQEYHTKIFDYAMDYAKPGQPYPWETYSAKGIITAQAAFVSKSKANCRNFTESFTVTGGAGTHSAIACKRGGDNGWCVLRPDQALTCAMETRPILPGFSAPNSPDISAPKAGGIGPVGTPNTNVNPNVGNPLDVDTPRRGDKPGQPVADTVTGTAGRAAGPATGGMIQWFSDTFR